MKTRTLFVAIIAILFGMASVNAVKAQTIKAYAASDSTINKTYSKNAYMVVRHGNNSAKLEVAGLYDVMDKSFGAQAKLYWFHYGWMYGLDGSYMENRSSVSAFAGYRFTRPSSPVFAEANIGAGLTQQWNISGNAGDIAGDLDGEYVMLLASSKMSFSAFGEVKLGARLSNRVELFAGVRGLYLPYEGKYNDTANTLLLESNGKPVQVFEKSAEGKKELLVEDLSKFHIQVSLGVSIWF